MIKQNKLTTLRNVAIQLRINKSQLHHYFRLGLLKPVGIKGKALLFEKDKLMDVLLYIKERQKEGITLKQLKDEINRGFYN